MDLGESLVAAYLRHVRKCDVVLKNVHLSGKQGELDVVGVDRTGARRVWLCEVTTHIRGMNNPAKTPAKKRVAMKIERASEFASEMFPAAEKHFEIWSPRVRPALLADLEEVAAEFATRRIAVDLVVNEAYTERIQELIDAARSNPSTTGEDAFRLLQILTHVRGELQL